MALYLCSYLCGLIATQLPPAVAYVAYLTFTQDLSLPALQAALQPDRLPLWLYLAFKVGEMVVLLPLTYAFCRWLDRRPFVSLGFRLDRDVLPDLLTGAALALAQMLIILAVGWAAGWLSVQWLDGAALIRGVTTGLLALVFFCLVALGEELIFRGYLQVNLSEGTPQWLAIGLSAILFGLFHVLNPHFSWLALLNIVLAGLVMGYGRAITGSLWLPLAYHLSWNWSQGPLLGLPVSGMRSGGLLSVVDRGTVPWLTGASFGPEGGLIGTVALLAAFPVLWAWDRWRRRRG